MTYYSQFFSYKNGIENLIKQNNNEYIFTFLGNKKNRINEINQIKAICDNVSKNSYWKVVENEKDYVPYIDYLSIMINSKCIVDVIIPGQTGLSLRPMEALFFNKKLITNNLYIKKMDFYHPNNIFIIGIDNDIKNFMKLPNVTISDNIKNNYKTEEWCRRIINENNY